MGCRRLIVDGGCRDLTIKGERYLRGYGSGGRSGGMVVLARMELDLLRRRKAEGHSEVGSATAVVGYHLGLECRSCPDPAGLVVRPGEGIRIVMVVDDHTGAETTSIVRAETRSLFVL